MRDGGVEIEVCDQGPGVAAGDREAVFTPFFTTKEHGTGLGLAIAREFTEAHGGTAVGGDRRTAAGRASSTWLPLAAVGSSRRPRPRHFEATMTGSTRSVRPSVARCLDARRRASAKLGTLTR